MMLALHRYVSAVTASTSPEGVARARRVLAAPAPNGGDGGGDDSPKRGEPRDPLFSEGKDPWTS
eukprot:6491715-Amphidinium_carterae.1